MNRKEYERKRNELYAEAQNMINEGKIEEANAKMDEIKNLDDAFEAAAKAQANLEAMNSVPNGITGYAEDEHTDMQPEDIYNSVEYRTAFMNFMNGKPMPVKFSNEAGPAKTSGNQAVISPVVVQRIMERMEAIGMILPLVTQTSFAPGAVVPKSAVKPIATWVAEGKGSDVQGKTTDKISINGNKLRCEISLTLEAAVMSLELFETLFVKQVADAMVKALENSMLNGTGSGMPKGILKETAPEGQNIDIAKTKSLDYATLTKAEGMLPLAYETGAVWLMTKKTFMEFVGMVDSNGQPIARINYGINGMPERSLLGRKVICNDYMTSINATLTQDTVVACIFRMEDYMLNTNYAMRVSQKEDWDTEDQKTKAVMIADGEVIDVNSLVTLTKKTA